MNKNYDISLVLSSIHPDTWPAIYKQIEQSVGKRHTFEVVAIGPNLPSQDLNHFNNFRFIRDFGSPSRCVQLASTVCAGRYVTWVCDDAIVEPEAYSQCIDYMDNKDEKDVMNILFSEGPQFSGNQHYDPSYWLPRTHDALRGKNIKEEWSLAIFGMYNLDYYRLLGGIDCRWEHINMNSHDLVFRAQRDGAVVYNSPCRVLKLDWAPWNPNNKTPIQLAYEENDGPLAQKVFNADKEGPIQIDYHNWRETDLFWKRRH